MKQKYEIMNSIGYRTKKSARMEAMKKARTQKAITTPQDYFALSNSISGQNRIFSRAKINKRFMEKVK